MDIKRNTRAHLGEMPLEEFIRAQQAEKGLLVFQHIPKTAGSSLNTELRARLRMQNLRRYREEGIKDGRDQRIEQVAKFLKTADMTELDGLAGHMSFAHVGRLSMGLPDARFFTFLRSPVERFISGYRYQCTDQHPGHKQFRDRFPTIHDFLKQKAAVDRLSHYVVRSRVRKYGTEAAIAAIPKVDNFYFMVGVLEHYDMSFNILTRCFGQNGLPVARARTTKPTEANAIDLTDDLRAEIEERHPADMAIYRYFEARMLTQKEQWEELMAKDPPREEPKAQQNKPGPKAGQKPGQNQGKKPGQKPGQMAD